MSPHETSSALDPIDLFVERHIGPRDADIEEMLATLGLESLEALVQSTVPESIRRREPLRLPGPRGERDVLGELERIAAKNQVFRSFLGMGYHDCIVPPVIQRNVLENPGWYTQYTPYQAEIAQGRLEALLVFQTLVAELTGLPIANASLLDEATAAAEAMHMCAGSARDGKSAFFVAEDCHPQTIAVVRTRARPLGIEVRVGPTTGPGLDPSGLFGALVQYPTTDGRIRDYRALAERVHGAGALVVVATDLLALTLITPPGELGADVAVGSSQRFGVPLGFGGPHAAFLSARDALKRQVPGRIVGISRDAAGKPAYRLALQTREQHIRREKATSNICTAQVLLAVMAAMYAVYHGPKGLRRIAERLHRMTKVLHSGLVRMGLDPGTEPFFDTLRVRGANAATVLGAARDRGINLRAYDDGSVGVALDETVGRSDLCALFEAFGGGRSPGFTPEELAATIEPRMPDAFARKGAFLTQAVFNRFHSEHELTRYMRRLEGRDLSLTTSMIPLGSCTMKLNGTSEMFPVSWPGFSRLHPFAPPEQARGYVELCASLEAMLAEITGLGAVSLQPNAGSQGEYAGLLVVRAWHESRGQGHRKVCLIPVSAHGTNPASAVMAGYTVVPVACDQRGNVDLADLESKADQHRNDLAALMVTYPSTHGVFEEAIRAICDAVHARGGQVYMDGANMNAQVGLCRPGDIGADVCHLNLHKTFAIPHGGGGPGMGPIAVASHLARFLPGHPLAKVGGESAIGAVAAAPWGSPSILPISWAYISLMGGEGLTKATEVAILNANYMARRLDGHYRVLYAGQHGRVAHELIADARPFKAVGIDVDDIAKRLMDFGFHAPTTSFPVPGTLMIEPTESESREELDRLCDALIAIRAEIRAIEEGRLDRADNPLKNAPHTAEVVTTDAWTHPYSREQAAYPAPWVRERKFWPAVGRIDNAWGDRNLVTTCT